MGVYLQETLVLLLLLKVFVCVVFIVEFWDFKTNKEVRTD